MNKELSACNRRTTDLEVLIKRLQDENENCKKALQTYEVRVPGLEEGLQKHKINQSVYAQEASTLKQSNSRLEKELQLMKDQHTTLHLHIGQYEDKQDGK